jgi:hypothetical protein
MKMQLKVELTDKDFVVRNAETKEIIKRGTKREIEDFLDHLENLEHHHTLSTRRWGRKRTDQLRQATAVAQIQAAEGG